jgi:hypothetical protein
LIQYGFTRENEDYSEGAETIYRFYQPDGSHIAVTNYHLARATHEHAFRQAGFQDVQWHALEVAPDGEAAFGAAHWVDILRCQPVVGLSGVKE